jgi:predicted flap endonuclease-1-like 5' DNA nuclease
MNPFNEFINQVPDLLGVFLLMLSTFLIGYFSAWAIQRSKYSKIVKKIKRQANLNKLNNLTTSISDIETIFTEIKPKIVEVVKQTQQETIDRNKEEALSKSAEEIVEKARTSFITYTKSKPELNFENFGYGSKESKDDLTEINGIGPYIEQRLNEIGIYNYDQISRFKEEDIRILTELIDFFPGRIERDNWIAQAASLKTY